VFIEIHHFTGRPQMLGLAFLGILGGVLFILPLYCHYIYRVEEKMYDENGQIKPEKRMPVAVFASFLAPISLLWFGWSARPSVHWIVPILGSSLFPMVGDASLCMSDFVSPSVDDEADHARLERGTELPCGRVPGICGECTRGE
jgi:hypothetical protein